MVKMYDQANEIRRKKITTAQHDLEINKIFTVTNIRMVLTKIGQAMILSLLNNGEVWAPEHLKTKSLYPSS